VFVAAFISITLTDKEFPLEEIPEIELPDIVVPELEIEHC